MTTQTTIDFFVQAMIATLGMVAIALLAVKDGRVRRWGYIVGVVSEPFWLYAAWTARQWGVFFLALWWAWFYIQGAKNNWRVV